MPLFFDHHKYMMTAGNSPLENSFGKIPKRSKWDDMVNGRKPFETPERRQERIQKMIHKIETEQADASIARGYGVVSETAATSGQMTNIVLPDNKEDIYLSWIGDGLGIEFDNKLTILFNHEQILLDIFEGWSYYRQYLEKYPLLKGNEINKWNGRWISHRYDLAYGGDDPLAGFNPLKSDINGLFKLEPVPWANVIIGIAQKNSIENIVGYLYYIDKSNTTIGFIPFKLQDIMRPNQLYAKIFGAAEWSQNRRQIEKLYGTGIGLKAACQAGCIGIPAMEPKGLKDFLPKEKRTKQISRKVDEEQKIIFSTYLIWILAMLNNEKLWDMSREFAELLLKYEAGAAKARRDRTNNVNQLFESASTKQFLLNLIPIIEDEEEKSGYENIGKVLNMMPKDNFPYFNTLIRFQYALLNK
ncbi:hypothetical protein JCM15093_2807 [Bacteroides graminisolvens DSM 19988 = JCM 15093]|uniref:Uncharacterized protein n=1 Tax=Bacteroides graminisolvens DSM 19988 = JCM 15093 TaxID=1121097 RepID=A0A069D5G0_9BACE|nr:hypothetical protein JCM15093_2807 [Bacteroides graminisolvens DSM 19988 = JCM 15093]